MTMNSCRLLLSLLMLGVVSAGQAAIPAPRNETYPGLIGLDVDLRDVGRRLIVVHETLPVRQGPLTLLYPQWIPGHHAPRGLVDELAGLTVTADGRPLAWRRDPVDVFAFHMDVPFGVSSLDVTFQVATPQTAEQGRIVLTPTLLNLQWTMAVLYPAGYFTGGIGVEATVHLPPGWRQASALPVRSGGDTVQFAPVSLENLADSPLFAGVFSGMLDLAPGDRAPVHLNIFAESATDIAATVGQLEAHRALVREAYLALGAPHFERYDFLVALSENLGSVGLEHLRSSENTLPPAYFRSWDESLGRREQLPHEFTHAWNGKYRRPADLWTPNFNVPMQDDLLWVYEGMTQYYGLVLAARAGLLPVEFTRETFASMVAVFDAKRPGRSWRSLADTTHQPILTPRRPLAWASWQRTEDYYSEAALLWLGVDAKIRALTGGARTLDDMASRFFAAPPTRGPISTYRFSDVVQALNDVAPFDWRAFLAARVDAVGAPLDGPALAGLSLIYDDHPNAWVKDAERDRRSVDLSFSLGVVVSRDAALTEVVWESPAFKAGLTTGMTLIAVNGRTYSGDLLKEAITQARTDAVPLELLVKSQDRYRTLKIDYQGGLKYPHLVAATAAGPDRLVEILAPRRPAAPQAAVVPAPAVP
jgi:predicted metalloprotease with PDZ domain